MIELVQGLAHRAQRTAGARPRPAITRGHRTAWGRPLCHGATAFVVTATILQLPEGRAALGWVFGGAVNG